MTADARQLLDDLKRQVDANAPLAREPVLAEAAAQGRQATAQARDMVAGYADQLAGLVRERPLTTVLATFLGAYFLGRIGRYL